MYWYIIVVTTGVRMECLQQTFRDIALHLMEDPMTWSSQVPLSPTVYILLTVIITDTLPHQTYEISMLYDKHHTLPLFSSPASWPRVGPLSFGNSHVSSQQLLFSPKSSSWTFPNLHHAYCVSDWVHIEEIKTEETHKPGNLTVTLTMACLKTAFLCWVNIGSDHLGWALCGSWGWPGRLRQKGSIDNM